MSEEPTSPPPDPSLLNRQPKWFKPVFKGVIVASILFVVGGLFISPLVFRGRHRHYDQTEATSNARQIGLALFEFETEYGTFPTAASIADVTSAVPAHGMDLSGTSSNAIFRQLFVVNITQSEQMFYAKIKGVRKPDGIITPGNLLESGECGFAYISGLSSKDDPNTPVVLTPLIPGTTRFDPKPLEGKAVILRIDNTVRSYTIHKDGHIYDKGIDILSSKHPIWKGKAPDIRYPE